MQTYRTTSSNIDFQQIFKVLRDKIWLILSCVTGVLLLAILYIAISPRIFESRSVLRIDQKAEKVVNIQDVQQENLDSMDVMKTLEQSLLTDELLLQVIHENRLASSLDFVNPIATEDLTDDELLLALRKKLLVKIRRGSRLIDVTAQTKNPELAPQLINSLITDYLKKSIEQRGEVSDSANGFLVGEAERLKAKLAASEQELQEYRENNNAVSLEDKQNIVVDTLKTLNAKVTEARASRMKLESDVAQFKALSTDNPGQLMSISSIAEAPTVVDAKRRVSEQDSEFAKIQKRYGPEHPKFIQAQNQNSQLAADLLMTTVKAGEETEAACEAAKVNEQKLVEALREQEKVSVELNKMAIPYNVLMRNVAADRSLYESITTRLKETDVTKSLDSAPFKVIEQARVSTKPVKPRTALVLMLGFMAGLGAGICLALILDAMDTSLKSVDAAEQAFLAPVISAVPQISARKQAGRRGVPMLTAPASTTAEAFRSLRTSLELKESSDRKVLLFTSALPEEGKTFCSVNSAIAFAQYGYRTLIIDADLRRPSVAKMLSLEQSDLGLTDCLSGKATAGKAIQETSIMNLSVLAAGSLAVNPAELLTSEKLGELLNDPLFALFDRIIFDTPPVNAVSDAFHLLRFATSVCLVVRAAKTSSKDSQRAFGALVAAKAPEIGIVLNRLPQDSCYYQAVEYGRKGVYGSLKAIG